MPPVPVPQRGISERDVTIQFTQQQQLLLLQNGPAPSPLTEPGAVIPLYPPTGGEEEPPRFTVPLRNQTVNDGERVVFQVS